MSNRRLCEVFEEIEKGHGYITEDIAKELLEDHQEQTRLLGVLVRFRDARCLCSLQYLDTFVEWANLAGSHVRDVSIPTDCEDWVFAGFIPKKAGYEYVTKLSGTMTTEEAR